MGTIREITKRDGSVMHHAEIRLRGHPPQRQSFRTKTQAKKWIQDTEAAIRDGRYKGLSAARKHTVGELIDRFIEQCVPQPAIVGDRNSLGKMVFKKNIIPNSLYNNFKKHISCSLI
jgi:hypothetical protein